MHVFVGKNAYQTINFLKTNLLMLDNLKVQYIF